MEHRAGLEADSEFEKNVAVAKAGIYSQPSLPAKHLNKSISWHDRMEDIWHPFFLQSWQTLPGKVCSSTQNQTLIIGH